VLFQLPPSARKDLLLLDAILAEPPPKVCAAFEFPHQSWLDEDLYERLQPQIQLFESPAKSR
jgi:uncharacterized protein YecE (DUF72 family)